MNARTAANVAMDVNAMSTARPTAVAHCPAQLATVTVLSFGYSADRSVELWYSDSGCQTLDNGFLEASEISNPPFYEGFSALVARLAPTR
jgi:hypothetical protein